ncbi:MAG: hypothetical protein LQ340_002878 [Diploschistes diacapsis]|nr:MAG: hypothetical protein LQ340_002878 [Diploschistes diacapsis]
MALVGYSSDSSNTSNAQQQPPAKRRHQIPTTPPKDAKSSLPPLPSSFLDLYSAPVRTSAADDPSLHGGRQRITPHVRDVFPTHIGTAIEKSNTGTFFITPIALKWVPNYPRTRWFLVLALARPEGNQLNKLLAACNKVARRFGQGELYSGGGSGAATAVGSGAVPAPGEEEAAVADVEMDSGAPCTASAAAALGIQNGSGNEAPSDPFHVSIAWSLSEPGADVSRVQPQPQPLSEHGTESAEKQLELDALEDLRGLRVPVAAVKVKVGNTISSIPLAKEARRVEEERGRKRWLGE